MTSTPTPDAYLLDTNVASIAWDGQHKNHALIRERLVALGESTLSICVVSSGEVAYGLEVTPGADKERRNAVRAAMGTYFVWSIDQDTAPYYGQLRGALFQRYSPRHKRGILTTKRPELLRDSTTGHDLGIQENDLWIVSVALQYGLHLISLDGKQKRILELAETVFSNFRYTIWTLPPSPPPDAS
jgi:tRNA(fMet)-specific endonuclease VapC